MVELYAYNAGKGDCLRVRFKGTSGIIHNIIVDTGTIKFGKAFTNLCNSIVDVNEIIDLLIITHHDDDHLGGLLYAVRHKTNLPFQTVLMNGTCSATQNVYLSVRQNNEILRVMSHKGISIKGALAKTHFEIDGAKINIISPTEKQLDNLINKKVESSKLSKRSDYGYDLNFLKDAPINYKDVSLSNSSSIVFIFEFDGKKLLFTGDAQAEHVITGLQHFSAVNNPMEFYAVKLPHHGSVGNISESWHKYINSSNYILCADGVNHPDKQTIAKLMKQNGNIRIFGTTDWWKSNFLTQADKKDYIDTKKLSFIKVDGKVLEW